MLKLLKLLRAIKLHTQEAQKHHREFKKKKKNDTAWFWLKAKDRDKILKEEREKDTLHTGLQSKLYQICPLKQKSMKARNKWSDIFKMQKRTI